MYPDAAESFSAVTLSAVKSLMYPDAAESSSAVKLCILALSARITLISAVLACKVSTFASTASNCSVLM